MKAFLMLGKHFICELSGCDPTILFDSERAKTLFVQAARDSGLSIMGEGHFDFSPHGLSYYLLLGESHAGLHVWPEYGYCAVDLFTCNLEIDTAPFFTAINESFGANCSSIQMIERGCVTENQGGTIGIESTIPLDLTDIAISEPGQAHAETPWGWHLVLNLYECDPDLIRSYEVIEKFVTDLCELIDMQRIGEPIIVEFGGDPKVAGYSMFQLIEASNLAGHFANKAKAAYLEMLDIRNRNLAEITRADDFVVSDRLISLILSQISENKALGAVFTDLFDPEGSEVYLKPAADYVTPGQPLNFYTVVEAARRRGEMAMGYRLQAHANDAAKAYGVVVNPDKSVPVTFADQDSIIFLAER